MTVETIKDFDIPVKFQTNVSNRFLCEVPFFDSFLVKEVHIPTLLSIQRETGDEEKWKAASKDNQPIVIVFHDSQAPSTRQMVFEAFRVFPQLTPEDKEKFKEKFVISIKQLDPVGNVISKSLFHNINFESFQMMQALSYVVPSEPMSITVSISFETCELEF